MDIKKIIPIILFVIILVMLYFAYSFWSQNKILTDKNTELTKENERLFQDKKSLQEKMKGLENELEELRAKRQELEEALGRLQQEKDDLQTRYNELVKERDSLVEKLGAQKASPPPTVAVKEAIPTTPAVGASDEEYWVDVVKKKAQLEVEVENLNKELLEVKAKLSEMDKTNKELSIKIDELTKEKERLESEISFKERTIGIMSRDLVKEREGRKVAIEELNKLRSENVGLKRELVLANKEKMQLQTNMKDLLEKKESLEKRIDEIDKALREKAILFEELQERMRTAVKGGKAIISRETASVELPPIVVKPQEPSLKQLQGEIIAVNNEQNFVVISLGESSGVKPGMEFKVVRTEKEIASLEVIETRKQISAADIKEVAAGFSLQKGDLVISK